MIIPPSFFFFFFLFPGDELDCDKNLQQLVQQCDPDRFDYVAFKDVAYELFRDQGKRKKPNSDIQAHNRLAKIKSNVALPDSGGMEYSKCSCPLYVRSVGHDILCIL